jgi:hypothetical protein
MDEQTTGITTLHIRKQQDMKLNALMQTYIQKTLVKKKKVDFFDTVLEMIEEKITSMPTAERNENGKIIYK